MNQHEKITRYLREWLADYRLDNDERYALDGLLSTLKRDEKRYLRNQAFDLVKEQIDDGENSRLLLGWLEKIVKVVDQSYDIQAVNGQAFFSPGETCRQAIIRHLNAARRRVDICVFTISDNQLSDTIVATHKRGIAVRVITDNDKAFDKGSDVYSLQEKGIPLCVDTSPNHMHHKFALVDQQLINGSFNWTRSASERNQENIIVTDNTDLLHAFDAIFEQLWQQFN